MTATSTHARRVQVPTRGANVDEIVAQVVRDATRTQRERCADIAEFCPMTGVFAGVETFVGDECPALRDDFRASAKRSVSMIRSGVVLRRPSDD